MTAHGPKILKTTNQTVPKVHILHTSSLHDQKVTTILYFVKLPTWSVNKNVGRVHAELFPRGWHAPQTTFNLVPYQSLGLRSWVSFLLSMEVSCWLVLLAHAQYLLVHAGIWRTTHSNDNILVQVLIPILKPLMTFKTVSMSSIQYWICLRTKAHTISDLKLNVYLDWQGRTFCMQVLSKKQP